MELKDTKRILLVSATEFEIAPFLTHLKENWKAEEGKIFKQLNFEIHVLISGVGIMATTFQLTLELAKMQYDYALQVGIGGVYATSRANLGDVIRISEDRLADLGVRAADNSFQTLADIGIDEKSSKPIIAPPLPDIFNKLSSLPAAQALTVQCPLGDSKWLNNFDLDSNAIVVESMEGSAFHYVCSAQKIPFVQLRSLSNWVEPRDKTSWKLNESISNLNEILIELSKSWINIS